MKEGGKGKEISQGGCRTHTQRKKVRVEEVLAPCKKKTPPDGHAGHVDKKKTLGAVFLNFLIIRDRHVCVT